MLAQAAQCAEPGDHLLAQASRIAASPTWLKLLHYRKASDTPSGQRSDVVSPSFFLHPEGQERPEAELIATLAAFSAPVQGGAADKHPQCVFPARFIYLLAALKLEASSFPAVVCSEYDRWSLNGSTQSLSIVFATGYLGNPASFYGHILLKLNGADATRHSDLLDTSVNYGAIVPDNVDPVSYVVKGVLGGYDGGFSHIQFYHHTHNYSENELRDLWEYRLALDQNEVNLIIAHAWELLGRRFTYYFFRENCAYRMAELIELAEGIEVVPARPWTIPQSLVQNISAARRGGQALVAETVYYPSRQARFNAGFEQLNGPARHLVSRIAEDTSRLDSLEFAALPPAEKIAVVDTLIDYFQFVAEKDLPASHPLSIGYRRALKARLDLPIADNTKPTPPLAPDQGRAAGMTRYGAAYEAGGNSLGLFELRPAYYDALDSYAGQSTHSALTMAHAKIVFDGDDLRLQALDFIRVESVNAGLSNLPGDDGDSWRVKIGLETQSLACKSCIVLRGQAAMGKSRRLGEAAVAGVYAGGLLQTDREKEGVAMGQLVGFASLGNQRSGTARLEYEYRHPLDGVLGNRRLLSFESRLAIHQSWDLRLRYDHQDIERISLTFGNYW